MATIGKVSAVFTASTSGLTSGVNQASRAMGSMQREVAKLRGGMTALVAINGAQLFGSVVTGASRAISGLLSMGQAQAEVIDSTSKLAARLGLTYGELAGLSLAGELAGVSMETIGAAATRADVAFVRASQGSRQAAEAFATLGLNVAELEQMSAAERFDAIASAIAALPTEAQRAAAAVQIFGRAGAELLPLFAGGAEGIARARAEAEAFGLTLTNVQGQNVEEMNDAFTRTQTAIQGVVQQVVAFLSPAVSGVVTQFNEFIANIGGANIGQAIGNGILTGAEFLAGVADFVIANFGSVFEYLSKVWEQAGVVTGTLGRVAAFLSGVWNSAQVILGSIILGFTGAFQGLATIARDIGRFLRFDTSSLDAVVAGAEGFNESLSNSITQSANAAAADFNRAFGEGAAPIGEAVAGPVTQAVRDWRAAAQAAQTAQDAAPTQPVEVRQVVEVSGITEALRAVDSRSSEGVAEMFRLMRGGRDNVQEQQLSVLEQIAANTASSDDLPASVEF